MSSSRAVWESCNVQKMDFIVKLGQISSRDEFCRDRRSRKICASCVHFSENRMFLALLAWKTIIYTQVWFTLDWNSLSVTLEIRNILTKLISFQIVFIAQYFKIDISLIVVPPPRGLLSPSLCLLFPMTTMLSIWSSVALSSFWLPSITLITWSF